MNSSPLVLLRIVALHDVLANRSFAHGQLIYCNNNCQSDNGMHVISLKLFQVISVIYGYIFSFLFEKPGLYF
jgi:hypothetical protein